MCDPAIYIPRGHSYQRRHPSADLLFHRSHAAGLFKAWLTNQLCCFRLLSGDTLCQRGHRHLPFVPFYLPSFLSSLAFHTDQSRAKYLRSIKNVANLWLCVYCLGGSPVSLHGVNFGSPGTSTWCFSWPVHLLSKAGAFLVCRNSREGCRNTLSLCAWCLIIDFCGSWMCFHISMEVTFTISSGPASWWLISPQLAYK